MIYEFRMREYVEGIVEGLLVLRKSMGKKIEKKKVRGEKNE